MKRRIWIISEGSPGHVSQSKGLLSAMEWYIGETECVLVETRPRLNGLGRSVVRIWMGRHGRIPPPWLESRLGIDLSEGPPPDLLLASGGKAVFAAVTLSRRFQVPLVFIGERKPYPASWFHTVLTPVSGENALNDLPLELIPTDVTPQRVHEAAANWHEKPAGRLWAMIIGGYSASHRYSQEDWRQLAEGMNALAVQHGIRWLLTTSRRTGCEVERLLKQRLDPAHLAYVIWWAERPEKKMLAFIGAAEHVFVTQDSVTMVTEAMASSHAVTVLTPADVRFPADSFLPSYFSRLQLSGSIERLAMCNLVSAPPAKTFNSSMTPQIEVVVRQLLSRLGWSF